MGKRIGQDKKKPKPKKRKESKRTKGKKRKPLSPLVRLRKTLKKRIKRITAPLKRYWGHIHTVWQWLLDPDEVGHPFVLGPRPMRSLVLIVAGSAAVLVLLALAVYNSTTRPLATQTPTRTDGLAIPTGPDPDISATPLVSGGAIAFSLRRDGNSDIYALNQEERQLVRLTHNPAEDREPTWSPDSEYIAFASDRSNNWDIYLLDLVSGILIRLTRDPAFDGQPRWSPDGKWIAFESYRDNNLEIYIMSTEYNEVRRITHNPAPDYSPAWAPDSSAIAFTSLRDGNKEIYIQTLDAPVEIVNLTNSPGIDEDDAAWSPDGTQLAYSSGSRGDISTYVVPFSWDKLSADLTQAEIFAQGYSPCWAPVGQTLTYAYENEGNSYVVAASVTALAQFHEVFSIEGPIDDMEWTDLPLSARFVSRALADAPETEPLLYVEMVQPTPNTGPAHEFVTLSNVEGAEAMFLSDAVNDSFSSLRERILAEAGWDYLATLTDAGLPTYHSPPPGHSRMSYHVCGRAIDLDVEPLEDTPPQIELVREDIEDETYWRVYLRAAEQDGSMGEPLREPVWDLLSRYEGGPAAIEGGSLRARIPTGYYVDFTTIASDYGWERVASLWRWRYTWDDLLWWQYEKSDGLSWWECMLLVYEPDEIEPAFGPIPGLGD